MCSRLRSSLIGASLPFLLCCLLVSLAADAGASESTDNQTAGTDGISGTGTFTCMDEVLTTKYDGVTATFDYVGEAN